MLVSLRRRWTPDSCQCHCRDSAENVSAGRLQLNRGLLRLLCFTMFAKPPAQRSTSAEKIRWHISEHAFFLDSDRNVILGPGSRGIAFVMRVKALGIRARTDTVSCDKPLVAS